MRAPRLPRSGPAISARSPRSAHRRASAVGVRQLGVGDREDHQLGGGEPGGEGAAVLLDEVRDGPLHAADDAAMDHDRPVFRAVRADVVQVEPLGLVEVDLDGGQGGLPAGAVDDLDVDLGAVERGLSLGRLVGQAGAVEDVGQQGGGPPPHLGRGDVLPAGAGQGEPVAGRA